MPDFIHHNFKDRSIIFKKSNESQIILDKDLENEIIEDLKSLPELPFYIIDNKSTFNVRNSYLKNSLIENYLIENKLKAYDIYEYEGRKYIHKNELIIETSTNITLEDLQNKLGLLYTVEQVLNKPIFCIHSEFSSIDDLIEMVESWNFIIKLEPNWCSTSKYYRNKISARLSNYVEQYPLPLNKIYEKLGFNYFNENLKLNHPISICIMDNGVYKYHKDLEAVIDDTNSKSFISGELYQTPNIKEYHGTWCAGILSANSVNNMGHKGVGIGTKLVSYRIVAGSDKHNIQLSNFDLINAFYSAAYQSNCDVINCSWTLDYESDILYDALSNVSEKGRNGLGLPIIFSAGNYDKEIKFPANHPNVITISAVDKLNIPLNFSFGSNVSIAAPGINVITTDIPDGAGEHYIPIRGINDKYKNYTYFNGTSAAAPIVSGCIARLLKHNNTLSLKRIKDILKDKKSLDDFNPEFINTSNEHYGAGILNLKKITKNFLENYEV